MQEVKGTEINEIKKPEPENFKNIKPEKEMNVESTKEFWNSIYENDNYDVHNGKDFQNSDDSKIDCDSIQPIDSISEKLISNQEEMKEINAICGAELKDSKPEKSPDSIKWIEKGGKIKIEVKDGKAEWTYINEEGIEVRYIDGYPNFPKETKHPFIGDINIGSFTGDREKDKKLYKEKLQEEYGLTDIPAGYVVHHHSENGVLQLIKGEYHGEFTHQGGHSKYKEGAN